MIEAKMSIEVNIAPTTREDIPGVLAMLQEAPPDSLLEVSEEDLEKWIDSGLSLVAKLNSGYIIGHQAAEQRTGDYFEGRAAFVRDQFRENGLGTKLKNAIDEILFEAQPRAIMVSFTEANSGVRGIVQKMGYKPLPMAQVPTEFFAICPDNCFLKTGEDCGCKVFVKSLYQQ